MGRIGWRIIKANNIYVNGDWFKALGKLDLKDMLSICFETFNEEETVKEKKLVDNKKESVQEKVEEKKLVANKKESVQEKVEEKKLVMRKSGPPPSYIGTIVAKELIEDVIVYSKVIRYTPESIAGRAIWCVVHIDDVTEDWSLTQIEEGIALVKQVGFIPEDVVMKLSKRRHPQYLRSKL